MLIFSLGTLIMILLVISLVLFLGVHLVRVLVPGFRRALIARLGPHGWRVMFSVASLLTLIFVIYAYSIARMETTVLYTPIQGMAHLTFLLMLIALICLSSSLFPPGHIAARTKYPFVLSVKIWALAHLLANGDTAGVLLFLAFLAWGVIVRISLKRRERAGEISRRPFVSAKYDLYAVVTGVVLWALLIWKLHEWLIGVSPLAAL